MNKKYYFIALLVLAATLGILAFLSPANHDDSAPSEQSSDQPSGGYGGLGK